MICSDTLQILIRAVHILEMVLNRACSISINSDTTDLNLMQLSLICPQAMTLLQVGRRWGVIGDLNYLIPFSQSLS